MTEYVNSRYNLVTSHPAVFYSNMYKRKTYYFSQPWTMVSDISERQFELAKNDSQALMNYFPYEEISKKDAKCGFNYLKGKVYLDYNDYAKFYLRCLTSSGIQATSDSSKGDFIAAIDFGLKYTHIDIDKNVSTHGQFSYSDAHNDNNSLWIAGVNTPNDQVNIVYKEAGLCDANGFSEPTVYYFNLNDVPDPNDNTFNNGIYTESEKQGYKGVLFNFVHPESISELSGSNLSGINLNDKTFVKDVVSIKFTKNPYNTVEKTTNTVLIKTTQDEYSKKAGMPTYCIQTGTGKMFTISVPDEYYIDGIFFLGGLGNSNGLVINGYTVINNKSESIVNNTSLPICPIEESETIWKANSNDLTSVSFADIADSGGSHKVSAIYVSYAKKNESLLPPTIPYVDLGSNKEDDEASDSTIKAVDLGLSVKWGTHNIGATEKTDVGNYYAWGSIYSFDPFNQNSYEWYDVSTGTYNIPATNISGTKYDVATHILGGAWRMPTDDELTELIDKCTWIATDNGFRVIGTNGNEIFLPFTGMRVESHTEGSSKLYYWSSTYNTLPLHKEDYWAEYLSSYISGSKTKPAVISNYVYNGMCIRPVSGGSITPMPDNPDTPSGNKYAVDLGLSVKWAKWNIGASSEEDYGNYIAWGDPTGKNASFINSDYPNDYDDISGTKYDTATSLWGKDWRMPTPDQWKELDNLTKELVTFDNGVKAFKVMASNGNYIYLPRGGYKTSKGLQEQNVSADYWTSENTAQVVAKGVMIGKVSSTFEPEDEKGWHMLVRAVCSTNVNPTIPDASSPNPDEPNKPDTPDDDNNTEVSATALRFTDTNDTGYSVDPNVILYAGGQEIIPKTMVQKDNTLFLGNYKESSKVFNQEMLDYIKDNSNLEYTCDLSPSISKGETGSLYMYDNQLKNSSYDIASFKGGEVYRFGLVFQNNRGEWSDVVYIGDYYNPLYPEDSGTSFKAPKAKITLNSAVTTKLYNMGYRKAKSVVVYPSISNRLVVCQGVLCPTVYNINERVNNSPYARSSWFYREIHNDLWSLGTQNKHNYNIYNDINDYIADSDRVMSTTGGYFGNGRK